jgi:hypothetical protein
MQQEGGDNSRFFTDGVRQLVTGLMMYIIESPTFHPTEKNLVRLYKMICGDVYKFAREAMESKNELIHSRLGRFAEPA